MATVLRGTRLSELSELPCRYAVLVLHKNAIKQFFNQCYRRSKRTIRQGQDEENDQIAHRRIVSGRRILRNYWRNNNSPATGPDSHLLDCIQRVFGSAAMRKIPAHDRSCEAVDYADQVPFRNCKVE